MIIFLRIVNWPEFNNSGMILGFKGSKTVIADGRWRLITIIATTIIIIIVRVVSVIGAAINPMLRLASTNPQHRENCGEGGCHGWAQDTKGPADRAPQPPSLITTIILCAATFRS